MNFVWQISRSPFKQLGWLCGCVLILRACTGLAGWQSLQQDPDAYAQLAVNLSDQGVLGFAANESIQPTAFRPPLYPWLLSWLVSNSKLLPEAVFALHLALALAIAVLTFVIAQRLGLRWPLLAGLLVSIDPLLIRSGQQVMTELLATGLAAMAWWLWLIVWPPYSPTEHTCPAPQRSPGQWAAICGLGIVFGLSILARPTAAPWAVLCIGALLWFGCVGWNRRLNDALAITIGLLLCVLPWTLRNMAEFGRPIWATTHGGYTLLLANNPALYQHMSNNGPSRDWDAASFHHGWANRGVVDRDVLMQPSHWLPSEESYPPMEGVEGRQSSANDALTASLQVHSLGELADDQLAYELARQTIQANPQTFVLSCFYRLGWLWAWWPNGTGKIPALTIGLWYAAVFFLAAYGLLKLPGWAACDRRAVGDRRVAWSLWFPGLALIVVLSAVHCFYWSNMRMRAPAMPCVYLLALIPLGKRIS